MDAIDELAPVWFDGSGIHIDSKKFFAWNEKNSEEGQCVVTGIIPLIEKTPVIALYEDDEKTVEYCLETEDDENFSGLYFHVCARLSMLGNPQVPVAQIDGFVADTPDEREMSMKDVGYRMEGRFLKCGGEMAKKYYDSCRGADLPGKALKYPGFTTPSNIRLIGICPDCGKSFAFHGYAFYNAHNDVAYSDDGLDCCEIREYEIDKLTWSYEVGGKTFRYYNSFCCPHCGTPYIDYKKYPQMKVFGVSGCVLIGRKSF